MVPHAPQHTALSGQIMCGEEVDVHNVLPRGRVDGRFRRSRDLLFIKIRVSVSRGAYLMTCTFDRN